MNRRRFLQSGALLSAPTVAFAQNERAPQADATPLPPAVMALPNRKGEGKPITIEERARRLERARELMRENKQEALLLAGGTSLNYFTGVRWSNSERLMCFVLPARGKPFFVCPHFEKGRLDERLSSVPDSKNIGVYLWQEDESPSAMVRKGLADAGVVSGSLGVEEEVPFTFANAVGKANPAVQVVDATPVTAGCRMIKSPAERELIRIACSITMQVYEAVWKSVQPGITTRDFSALCARAYAHMGYQGDTNCQTGPSSALPHGSLLPQVIREDAMILIDDGCVVEGYQSDISRAWVYGKPSDTMLRRFDVVKAAQAAARAAARSGAECQAVDAAARKVIDDAGFGPDYKTFVHRVGHGMGMDVHEWPYLVRGNTLKMKPGMVFSDEPALFVTNEFGLRLEDDMFIKEEGGAEWFTPQQPSLMHPFGA